MKGLEQYQSINTQSNVLDADGHQLITLLFDKIQESLLIAKASIENNVYDKKSTALNKAIEILGGLREFLDLEKGGDIALKLEQLYEWSERTLFAANVANSIEKIEQVEAVIKEIKEGWVGIKDHANTPAETT